MVADLCNLCFRPATPQSQEFTSKNGGVAKRKVVRISGGAGPSLIKDFAPRGRGARFEKYNGGGAERKHGFGFAPRYFTLLIIDFSLGGVAERKREWQK
jgi:hypothetical protein